MIYNRDGRYSYRSTRTHRSVLPRWAKRFLQRDGFTFWRWRSDGEPGLDLDHVETPLGIRMYEDEKHETVFIPMVAKEDLIGGIEIGLEGRHRRFSANEQKLLYGLASQAAMTGTADHELTQILASAASASSNAIASKAPRDHIPISRASFEKHDSTRRLFMHLRKRAHSNASA